MTAAENIVRKWDHCELGTRVSESSFDLSHHGTEESLREQIRVLGSLLVSRSPGCILSGKRTVSWPQFGRNRPRLAATTHWSTEWLYYTNGFWMRDLPFWQMFCLFVLITESKKSDQTVLVFVWLWSVYYFQTTDFLFFYYTQKFPTVNYNEEIQLVVTCLECITLVSSSNQNGIQWIWNEHGWPCMRRGPGVAGNNPSTTKVLTKLQSGWNKRAFAV